MKRSEFETERRKHWTARQVEGLDRGDTVNVLVTRDVLAARAAGVTWDPEGGEEKKARDLGRERQVYAGLPPNALEVSAPDDSPPLPTGALHYPAAQDETRAHTPAPCWCQIEEAMRRQASLQAHTVLDELEAEACKKIREIVRDELRTHDRRLTALEQDLEITGLQAHGRDIAALQARLFDLSVATRTADDELAERIEALELALDDPARS